MPTSLPSLQQLFLPLTFGVPGGPVKTSATPTPSEPGYRENEADCSEVSWNSLPWFIRSGSSWKTFLASSQPMEARPLRRLSTNLKRSGIWGDGFRATSSMRVFPKTGIASSLSQVINQIVPINSLLTAANCLGILRREDRAGRKLDPIFEETLRSTVRFWSSVAEASGTPLQQAFAPRYVPKLESIKAAILTDQYSVARNLTWNECEALMGFPPGWTVVEDASSATQSHLSLPSGLAAG